MAKELVQLKYLGFTSIGSDTRLLKFSMEEGNFDFKAGQYIQIEILVDGEKIKRSYSIANSPNVGGQIEIALSEIEGGRSSSFLSALVEGSKLFARGPFGHLILLEEPPTRHVMLSASTGLAPFRAMLPILTSRLEEGWPEVCFLIGARSRDDLLFRDELIKAHESHRNFRLLVAYSRDIPIALESWERFGRVQDLIPEIDLLGSPVVFYLCGKPEFVDELERWLIGAGISGKAIRRERYIAGA